MSITLRGTSIRGTNFATAAAQTDPYYNDVALLLHFDGATGSTNLVDSSQYNQVNSIAYGAEISTDNNPFGGNSLKINKVGFGISAIYSGPEYSKTSASAGYTVEFWYKFVSSSQLGTAVPRLVQLLTAGNFNLAFTLDKYSTGNNLGYRVGTNTVVTSITIPVNEWVFLAVTCDNSNNWTLWVNGIAVETQFNYIDQSPLLFNIGVNNSVDWDCESYISEMRVTPNVIRYTSTFTPPTAPFPNS